MSQDTDISWQVLRRIVADWAGPNAELVEVKPLMGGCINTTLSLGAADGRKAVLKISTHRVDHHYSEEAHQLSLLRDAGVPTPTVLLHHLASLDHPHSYLLMEFVPGVDLHSARDQSSPDQYAALQRRLAEATALLHTRTADQYHRCLPEGAPGFDDWATFYRQVYDPIWHEVAKSELLPVKTRKLIGKIHDRLDRLLVHDDRPRLTHWDLWATNVLTAPDDTGAWRITAFLDPNAKYAHADAEIAYLELFHTVTPAFMEAYQSHRPLSPDYARLHRPIYQLYPLINHVHLFGAEYVKPLLGVAEQLVGVV